MSGKILDQTMHDLMSGIAGTQFQLFQEIMEGNAATLWQFKQQLLSYLQEQGVNYQDCRKGGNNKQSENGLIPQVEDFVTYKSGAKTRFGRIAKVIDNNVVILTVKKRNRMEEISVHVQMIRCIYRATDENNCTTV